MLVSALVACVLPALLASSIPDAPINTNELPKTCTIEPPSVFRQQTLDDKLSMWMLRKLSRESKQRIYSVIIRLAHYDTSEVWLAALAHALYPQQIADICLTSDKMAPVVARYAKHTAAAVLASLDACADPVTASQLKGGVEAWKRLLDKIHLRLVRKTGTDADYDATQLLISESVKITNTSDWYRAFCGLRVPHRRDIMVCIGCTYNTANCESTSAPTEEYQFSIVLPCGHALCPRCAHRQKKPFVHCVRCGVPRVGDPMVTSLVPRRRGAPSVVEYWQPGSVSFDNAMMLVVFRIYGSVGPAVILGFIQLSYTMGPGGVQSLLLFLRLMFLAIGPSFLFIFALKFLSVVLENLLNDLGYLI